MLRTNEQEKPDKLLYSIPDTAWVLGNVSQNHVRNLIEEKVLTRVPIGRRVMVTAASIKALLDAGGTNGAEHEDAA